MTKINVGKIIKVVFIALLIGVVLLIGGYIAFYNIRIKTEGRYALREAKNAALAIRLYDINEYAVNESVFDTSCQNNISEGARKAVYDNLEHECYISLISYDEKERMVTNFIYGYGDYIVEFKSEDGQDVWTVNYVKKVLEY